MGQGFIKKNTVSIQHCIYFSEFCVDILVYPVQTVSLLKFTLVLFPLCYFRSTKKAQVLILPLLSIAKEELNRREWELPERKTSDRMPALIRCNLSI